MSFLAFLQNESRPDDVVDQGGYGSVVTLISVYNPVHFPEAFPAVIPEIRVQAFAGFGAGVPVVRPVPGRYDGMGHAENQFSAVLHPVTDLPHQPAEVLNIIKYQGTGHQIELIADLICILHGHPLINDIFRAVMRSGVFQHFFRNIDSENRFRAHFRKLFCMLAHAAADIQNLLPAKIREHGKKNRRLDAVVEIDFLTPAVPEILKESVVVVDVLS